MLLDFYNHLKFYY